MMLRTISNVFALPLVAYCIKKKLYLDALAAFLTMIASTLFHYVEEKPLIAMFDIHFWGWLCIDHFMANMMSITVVTYITGFGQEMRSLLLYAFMMIELVLDLHYTFNTNENGLMQKNLIVCGLLVVVIIVRREYIRASRCQCIIVSVLCVLTTSLLAFFNEPIEITHSLFHIMVFLTTLLAYYWQENGLEAAQKSICIDSYNEDDIENGRTGKTDCIELEDGEISSDSEEDNTDFVMIDIEEPDHSETAGESVHIDSR